MAGKVYIANVSTSATTYAVNDAPIVTPGRPMNPSTFSPYFVLVGRSKYPEPRGTFAFGRNPFSATFADTIPPETPRVVCVIDIPVESSVDDDLILYVYRNGVLLITKRGDALPPNPEFIPNATCG